MRIGSRDPAKGRAFAARLTQDDPGARVSGSGMAEAAAGSELCVLAVPYSAHAETLNQIRDGVQGKIVIDATVPLRPPKVGTVQLPPAGSAAQEAQQALGPAARVVSALQNIGAEKLASHTAVDADVLVASNDAEAAAEVCTLLERIGLRAWHVGPLANSAAAEALTSVLIQINRRYNRVQAGVRITGEPKGDGAGAGTKGVQVYPLLGIPLLQSGDDLESALIESIRDGGVAPRDGDVLVVAQKVVSKVEGRQVALQHVTTSARGRELAGASGKAEALAELIASESSEIMRVRDGLVISRHRSGLVVANAGIDASNVCDPTGPETVLLWPEDPDASAEHLRRGLEAHFGVRLAVIISDSVGRAWRMGTTGTAIGVSGLRPLRDRRGETDLFGRVLQATLVAVADELAGAASLVIGEAAEGVPAALIRGATYEADDAGSIQDLLRPAEQDLFP